MQLASVLEYARELVEQAEVTGGVAIDGTMGNGHDTRFLAEQVGATGHVYGFDVQSAALAATDARLRAAGLRERATLLHVGHEALAQWVPREATVRAIMFNLGYLPGGDHGLITQPATTLAGLTAAWARLVTGGVLTIVLYPGHPGGAAEAMQVQAWAATLPHREAQVLHYQFLNPRTPPPSLLALVRR